MLLFVAAIALFAVGIFYTGGLDYVRTLLPASWFGSASGGNGKPAASTTPTATPDATTTTPAQAESTVLKLPAGVSEELAKRMYVEQIQSQVNLQKMADGEITVLRVNSVKVKDDRARVDVTAKFSDGSSAPGVIQLVKIEGTWYFVSITGLASDKTSGFAVSVQRGTVAEGEKSNAETIAESGVTVFDIPVMNTFLEQQVANQTVIVSIIEGGTKDIELGKPKPGAGTVAVPSTFTGPSVAAATGDAVLIEKTVDSEDLTFLTMFRAN